MPPQAILAMRHRAAGQGQLSRTRDPTTANHWRQMLAAIGALGPLTSSGERGALVTLVATLGDGRRRERLEAALALDRVSSPVARAALWRAAREDPVAGVRLAALRSLSLHEEEVSDARTARTARPQR